MAIRYTCIQDASITGAGDVRCVLINGVYHEATAFDGPYSDGEECDAECGVAPTVDFSDAPFCDDDTSLTITGTHFTASSTVDLRDSANVAVAHTVAFVSPTELTLTLTSPPIANLGAMTAIVTTENGNSGAAVQVADVIACTPGWLDTYTDSDDTTLTDHTPDTSPGGTGYTAGLGTFKIVGNKLRVESQESSGTSAVFDPLVQATRTGTIKFTILDNDDEKLSQALLTPRADSVEGFGVGIIRDGGAGGGDTNWSVYVEFAFESLLDVQSVTLLEGVEYELEVVDDGTNITATVNSVSATISTTTDASSTSWSLVVISFSPMIDLIEFDDTEVV